MRISQAGLAMVEMMRYVLLMLLEMNGTPPYFHEHWEMKEKKS